VLWTVPHDRRKTQLVDALGLRLADVWPLHRIALESDIPNIFNPQRKGRTTNAMELQPRPAPETEPEIRPRIYVASLSDYNAGRLHGTWIDATQDPEDVHEAVQRMLATSQDPLAEEWAIHDYEGFGPARLPEYCDVESVSRIAQGIETHGDAFAAWIAHTGDSSEKTADKFDEAYLGRWNSITDYAQQFAEDLGLTDGLVPEWARPYVQVDIDLLARDLEIELVIAGSEEGGIDVFDPTV
jgi:antirestriction protein